MSSGTYFKMYGRKKNMTVKCPAFHCGLEMTLRDFVTVHVRRVHRVNRDLQCPFCMGAFDWGREERTTERVNEHRMECIKERFPHLFRPPKGYKVPIRPRPCDSASGPCQECLSFVQLPTRGMSGRRPCKAWGTFYKEVGQLPPFLTGPLLPTHVSYSKESGLGDFMHPILHQFLENTHMWYHVSVRAAAWKSFVAHILSINGVYVLPYWCLCDGMKAPLAKLPASLKHHRHMVLVKEKNVQLDKEWKTCMRVKNTAAKLKFPIKTIHQLINTLFYVSQSKAQCDGTACKTDDDDGNSHYYLHHALSPHAKVAMSVLVPNGLSDYIHSRAKQRKARYWYDEVKGIGRDRSIPVKTLNIPIVGCVVPVTKHLEPSHLLRVTEDSPPPTDGPYLWMYPSDQVMVLKSNPSLLEMPLDDWYEHQRKHGNSFLDAVHEEKYMLRQRHRSEVNDFQSIKHELMEEFEVKKSCIVKDFEAERSLMVFTHNEKLERQHAKWIEMENELLKCRKERDDERMQRQYLERTAEAVEVAVEKVRNQMSAENNALKSQLRKAEEARIQQYEDRIAELKKENETLQQIARGAVSFISKTDMI